MQRKTLLLSALSSSLFGVALFGSDFWKTKDYTQWTSDEVAKVLTDSPWAKQISVTSEQTGGEQRRGGGMGRGGGGGRGGGIGLPGAGGGGYPGGGGGGGRGGGQYPNDSGGGMREQIVVRWESALPVQQALLRQGGHPDDKSKYYVVSVLGLRLPSESQNTDDLRTRFLDAAQLIPKSKIGISAEDIQFEGRNGSTAMRFLFPKTFPISGNDKEIVFHFQSQGMKFDHKFKLSDMQYQGQLAL
jgi:hypothetical protein